MSLSAGAAIADAITTAINAGPLTGITPATRKHAFAKKLEDVAKIGESNPKNPTVTVFVKGYTRQRISRATWAYMYEIGVCVQSYCQFSDTTRAEELNLFVQGIADFLSTAGAMNGAPLMTHELDPLFDSQHLETCQQFHSTPTFTYRLERSS